MLTTLLDMAAQGAGDRVVIGRRADGLSAAELSARADAGAALIRERGADALVYLALNGPAFPIALFAAARAGVPLVPLNYRLGQNQIDDLLVRHPGAIGIGNPTAICHLERHGIPAMTSDEWLMATKEAPPDSAEFVEANAPDHDAAVIIYTSGTTSSPKGVVLRHSNLMSYVIGSVEFMSADPDDAALVSVPPYHIAAVANVITNLYAGRRALVLEAFVPEDWLSTVREEGITTAMVVPTMLARIIDCDADKRVSTLRSLSYGGAPMPSGLIERALREWSEVGFVNAYGLTETSSTVAVLGPEDHRAALASTDVAARERLSSVGRPLPGIDLEIRDPNGAVLGSGQVGRICVRGPQVSGEYVGRGSVLDAGGFFDTKDEGYVDEEGYLFVGGRSDDTIIRGGENIAPAEIEDVLLRHPAVSDAVVFGVADEEWGHRIEAAIVVRRGASVEPQELSEFARATLRSSKTPCRFWFVDELPRTETGKLLRRKVVDLLPGPATTVG